MNYVCTCNTSTNGRSVASKFTNWWLRCRFFAFLNRQHWSLQNVTNFHLLLIFSRRIQAGGGGGSRWNGLWRFPTNPASVHILLTVDYRVCIPNGTSSNHILSLYVFLGRRYDSNVFTTRLNLLWLFRLLGCFYQGFVIAGLKFWYVRILIRS